MRDRVRMGAACIAAVVLSSGVSPGLARGSDTELNGDYHAILTATFEHFPNGNCAVIGEGYTPVDPDYQGEIFGECHFDDLDDNPLLTSKRYGFGEGFAVGSTIGRMQSIKYSRGKTTARVMWWTYIFDESATLKGITAAKIGLENVDGVWTHKRLYRVPVRKGSGYVSLPKRRIREFRKAEIPPPSSE